MTQEERRGWLHAAYKALGDIPADKLGDAVAEAMRTVDHPSKIVPAIRKALEGPGRYQSNVTIVAPSHEELEAERRRREADNSPAAKRQCHEMAELMRGLRERLEANSASDAA